MTFKFPAEIPPGLGNYVSAGGVVYAANTLSKAWTKREELVFKNNQLRSEREKTFLEHNRESIKQTRAIYRDYKQGVFSESVRDDLLEQVKSAAPIYIQTPKMKSQSTQTSKKLSSITLSNQQRNSNNKNYKSEVEVNDLFVPYEFQNITPLPFIEVFKAFILIVLFGFVLRIAFNKLARFINEQIEITRNRKKMGME